MCSELSVSRSCTEIIVLLWQAHGRNECLGPCPEGNMEGSDHYKMEETTKALSLSVLCRLRSTHVGRVFMAFSSL